MQYTKESKIVAVADVKEFFSHLVDERQVAFHLHGNRKKERSVITTTLFIQ